MSTEHLFAYRSSCRYVRCSDRDPSCVQDAGGGCTHTEWQSPLRKSNWGIKWVERNRMGRQKRDVGYSRLIKGFTALSLLSQFKIDLGLLVWVGFFFTYNSFVVWSPIKNLDPWGSAELEPFYVHTQLQHTSYSGIFIFRDYFASKGWCQTSG